MDKFALVYEFNKNSPLIVYKASKEIEDRNISNAIELLNSSIKKYPYYSTAYFLLATALAYNNQYKEAEIMVTRGNILLDEKETAKYYLGKIKKIKKENEGIDNNFSETIDEVLDKSLEDDYKFYDFDDLGDNKVITSKKIEKENLTKSKISNGTIVTETLAEIYHAQGNYVEALDIYERLIKLQPGKIDIFNKKILEINNTIISKK